MEVAIVHTDLTPRFAVHEGRKRKQGRCRMHSAAISCKSYRALAPIQKIWQLIRATWFAQPLHLASNGSNREWKPLADAKT